MDVQNAFHSLNWLAIIVAAISTFALEAVWYSPLLFIDRWMKESGISEETARQKNFGKLFFLTFLLSLVASFFLALFIGKDIGGGYGALAGLVAGVGWVFPLMGVSYLFEKRSMAHLLINGTYSVVSLTLMGFIIGIWQ